MAKAADKKKDTIVVPETKEGKKKALKAAIAHIRKEYGDGAVMRLGENRSMDIEAIPTGSLLLDMALGVGGVPRGRIIELYGPESSGKTTVALHIIAQAQKLGGEAAFIDVEHALDPNYARALGVNIDDLLISQPDSGEQALDIADLLLRSGALDVVVVDSVAALTTRAEIDGDMGDTHVGQLARLMSQAMRKLTAIISRTNTVVVFINQIREKIGILYGNPETTPGGRALKFYASVRMDVRKGEPIKEGSTVIGAKTKIKVTKNKVAPPFKECVVDLIYGKGIQRENEVIQLAVDFGIVKKSGSWYSYNSEKIGQGMERVVGFLQTNPTVAETIERGVIAEIKKLNKKSTEDDENDSNDTTAKDKNPKTAEEKTGSGEDANEENAAVTEDSTSQQSPTDDTALEKEADDTEADQTNEESEDTEDEIIDEEMEIDDGDFEEFTPVEP